MNLNPICRSWIYQNTRNITSQQIVEDNTKTLGPCNRSKLSYGQNKKKKIACGKFWWSHKTQPSVQNTRQWTSIVRTGLTQDKTSTDRPVVICENRKSKRGYNKLPRCQKYNNLTKTKPKVKNRGYETPNTKKSKKDGRGTDIILRRRVTYTPRQSPKPWGRAKEWSPISKTGPDAGNE